MEGCRAARKVRHPRPPCEAFAWAPVAAEDDTCVICTVVGEWDAPASSFENWRVAGGIMGLALLAIFACIYFFFLASQVTFECAQGGGSVINGRCVTSEPDGP